MALDEPSDYRKDQLECRIKERSIDPYVSLFDSSDYELISNEQFDETKQYPDIKFNEVIVTSIGEKVVERYVFRLKNKE